MNPTNFVKSAVYLQRRLSSAPFIFSANPSVSFYVNQSIATGGGVPSRPRRLCSHALFPSSGWLAPGLELAEAVVCLGTKASQL